MNGTAVDNDSARKKLILKVSAVFLGVMVLLTFFSNTINNFSLPRVKVEQPSSGSLIKVITSEGSVREKEVVRIYSRSSRKVVDILAKTGERVKKGDIILLLDREALEEELREDTLLLEKIRLSLEKLAKSSGPGELRNAERDIDTAKEALAEAGRKLANSKALLDAGAVSRDDYEKAQQEYNNAKKEYEKKLEDFYVDQSSISLDIRDKQYDLELQQMKVDGIRRELQFESEIAAPCDGIIKEINFDKGSMTDPDTALCTLADISKGFEFKAVVGSEAAGVLSVNDAVNINLKASKGKMLEGKLVEIKNVSNASGNGENQKELVVSLPQEGLSGGESGSIRINKQTKAYDMLVPNSSVGQDEKGKFVYVLKEKKGPLGNEYYIQRASVAIEDNDNFKSAVIDGIGAEERIVVYSSKDTLVDGCRVMLER